MSAFVTTMDRFVGGTSAHGSNSMPSGGTPDELCDLSAIELVARIRRKDVRLAT